MIPIRMMIRKPYLLPGKLKAVAVQAHADTLQTYANHIKSLDFDDAFHEYAMRAEEDAVASLS